MSAQYLSLVSRACPGAYTRDEIKWTLPPEEAWAVIHAYLVGQGETMVWPDAASNPVRRWWHGLREWAENLKKR